MNDKVKLEGFLKLLCTIGLVAAVMAPSSAWADNIKLPKRGMQYFTVGLSLNPGFLHDETASSVGLSTTALTAAGMAELGITQIVARNFYMSAEARAGLQWLNDNTADQDGHAPSSKNFAWQLGLYMQWLPLGEDLGLVGTAGLHLFRVQMTDAPLQVLGGEIRIGKYFWTDDEHFLLLEAGYSAPIIQGLDRPTSFDANSTWAERNWSFHRFSLGFEYGF